METFKHIIIKGRGFRGRENEENVARARNSSGRPSYHQSRTNEIPIFSLRKLFQLWVMLRIYATTTMDEMSELNTFHTNKFHIIDSINIVNWAGPFLNGE